MNGDDLANGIMDSEFPSGPVLVHVVDRDHEYWLEVTEIKTTTLVETGWVNGILIETQPIVDGVRARKDIFTPRPYFRPVPAEAGITATDLREMEVNGELDWIPQERPKVIPPLPMVIGIDPGDMTHVVGITGDNITFKDGQPEQSGASPDAAERFALLPDVEVTFKGEIFKSNVPEIKFTQFYDPNKPLTEQYPRANSAFPFAEMLHKPTENVELPPPDHSEPHYWKYNNAPEFQNPAETTTEE